MNVDAGGVWVEDGQRIDRAGAAGHRGLRVRTMGEGAAGAGGRTSEQSLERGTVGDGPPMRGTQPPGTKLTTGHEAPRRKRPPRPAAGDRIGCLRRGGRSRARVPGTRSSTGG